MTFIRSSVGIGNRVLFTQSDFTVYVESGAASDPVIGLDIAFWRQVLSELYPEYAFSFSPLGGKMHVKAMAEKVIQDAVPNVICIMDRDYDHLFGHMLADDRVFYTHGYGVENDILCKNIAAELIGSFLPHDADNPVHRQEIQNYLDATFSYLKWPVKGDKLGKGRDCCLLSRDKPQSDFYSDNSDLPVKLRYKPLYQKLKEIRPRAVAENIVNFVDRGRFDIPAHHYFEVVYQTIRRYIANFTKEKYSKKNVCTVAIAYIKNNYMEICDEEIRSYYRAIGEKDLSRFRST